MSKLFPGVLASVIVAIAAMSLAQHYGVPVMLFALLLGLSMNFLGTYAKTQPGIEFVSSTVLRFGIALLGLRITWDQVEQLGWQSALMVISGVVFTISAGVLMAKWLGFNRNFGLLTGGAVGICGASAALAISAAQPQHENKERDTLFAVIGVSTLSTLAMVTYPMLAAYLGLSGESAGIFLGATIHDVAQVIGAGYSFSHEAGDAATIVKLLRVTMLLPTIVVAALITRKSAQSDQGKRPPLLPWFAVAFAGLVALNSLQVLALPVRDSGQQVSQWCLVTAIAGIGMKTQLKGLTAVGWRPVVLMLLETLVLAGFVLIAIQLGST